MPDSKAEHPEEAAYADFSTKPPNTEENLKPQTNQITSYSEFSHRLEPAASDQIAMKSNELSAYGDFHHQPPASPRLRPLGKPGQLPAGAYTPQTNCVVRGYRFVSGTMPEAARTIEQWPVREHCLFCLSFSEPQ